MQTQINLKFTSAAVSDRGLSEKRPQNEDSYLDLREHGVFAVADGVGGAQAGDVASQMAVEILAEAFNNRPANIDAEDVMRLAIERANSAIFQMANDLPQLASMATTMVALQISGNIATIGHVGDSRLYRIDPQGGLHRETADHSVVEEEVRAGRMTPEQALNHPSRNVISRALGAEETVDVELKTIMVDPGTMFLLCSDGITRHIPDAEIEDLFAADIEPESLTNRMRDICYERGAEDNLTAVIVRISSPLGENLAAPPVYLPPQEIDTDDQTVHFEEDTVATSRAAVAGDPEVIDEVRDSDPEPTASAAEQMDLDDEFYLSDELIDNRDADDLPGSKGYTSSSVAVPASPIVPAPVVPPPAEKYVETVYDAQPANGSLRRVISGIFLLLVGSILGAAAYYFTLQPAGVAEPPPQLIEKSPDVSLTAFEESRRLIDKDPAAFINANAASPQDPEDYFLLGRAFLLTGKYWEAKRSFGEAKNRLGQADPKNAKTLAAEIAMAMAIIETPGASETFTKDLAAGNPSAAANTNTNVSANLSAPR
ncbi:MAG TPA: PP2C family serine/threonine-protein phosphatase [Pyrinomonadaceae bacterium]|nr:PP2C family serine/threonine-protein phosphatase [Pyrinomonadaceae bacterium]